MSIPEFQDDENQEKVEALVNKARSTPFGSSSRDKKKQEDNLSIVFNLNHIPVGENPIDYGFRGMIPLVTEGTEVDEKKRVKVKKGKPITIPGTIEEGVPRGYLKVENRTGRKQGMLSRPLAADSQEAKQIVLLKDTATGQLIGIIRPGAFYFGEPPAGDLYLECVDTEALVSYVAFPGSP